MKIKKPKIVVIGGGTGLSILLSGIKEINNIELSAIVTVFDNGSSTGVLRREFSIPAVGDIRQVISALSTNKNILSSLMTYRFKNKNSNLDNHSLGNLIITALIDIQQDFKSGIEALSTALNIVGKIIPVTDKPIHINAKTINDKIIYGESNIGNSKEPLKTIFYSADVKANPDAILAINEADYIIYGIGSLYTSIIPNIALKDIKEVLRITKAKQVYVCNIMQEKGETLNYDAQDHIDAIESHLDKKVIDVIIANSTFIPDRIIKKYEVMQQKIVPITLRNRKIRVMREKLIKITKDDVIRHDPLLIKKTFEKLIFN